MKLEQINLCKDTFKQALQDPAFELDTLHRLCVKNWQEHFDIDEMYLAPILKVALKNDISGRLWGGEYHSIKSGLIQLAERNPDLFWTALKDLFNEDRMIIMRTNRFMHHCDIIFDEIKRSDRKFNAHFQSYESACLLLSFQYPQHYCQFDYGIFEPFARKIGVRDIPVSTDLERYYKIVNVIDKIIVKDEKFMQTYYSRLDEDIYLGPSLEIVYKLMEFNLKSPI